MTKLDILMVCLGIASYVAVMIDLRNHEQKMVAFDAYQEKRRIYLQNMDKRRAHERAMKESAEKKAEARMELSHSRIEGAAEKLGSSDV